MLVQVVNLLLVSGADLHVANAYGHTPLAMARKGSSARQSLLAVAEGGPLEIQRLQQALTLRRQHSTAARESAAQAAAFK